MSLKWLAVLLLWSASSPTAPAATSDLQVAARGLKVSVEQLAGKVGVNGLQMQMARAVGKDVPELAEAMTRRWRGESGSEAVRVVECCGWKIASRFHLGSSQVIQWRSLDAAPELLWSSLPLGIPARATPAPSVALPGDCEWTAPVHGGVAGRRFLQVTARCRTGARTALQGMARELRRTGWKLRQGTALQLQADRAATQLQIIAAPAAPLAGQPQLARSTLVLLETQPEEERDP